MRWYESGKPEPSKVLVMVGPLLTLVWFVVALAAAINEDWGIAALFGLLTILRTIDEARDRILDQIDLRVDGKRP